jgi:CBS-domain-containing membrane protein
MRFVHLYLVGYFILIVGAIAALWNGDVLQHVPATWLVMSLAIAIGMGIMLAMSSGKPEISE